jgi:hypothetical protein
MSPLSPAAQAIWDAWNDAYEAQGPLEDMGQPIAAALRAAADQVVPATPKPNDTFCCPPVDSIIWKRVAEIRSQFLAIAAELEATTPQQSATMPASTGEA